MTKSGLRPLPHPPSYLDIGMSGSEETWVSGQGTTVDGVPVNTAITRALLYLEALTYDDINRPRALKYLAHIYFARYTHDRTPQFADIAAAIRYGELAFGLIERHDTGRHHVAHALGMYYWRSFLQTQSKSDIDKAIEYADEAVACTPAVDISTKIQLLQSLADHYCFRGRKFNNLEDVCSALETYAFIASLVFPGYSALGRLWNNAAAQSEIILNKTNSMNVLRQVYVSVCRCSRLIVVSQACNTPRLHDRN